MSADDEMHPVLAFTSGSQFSSVKAGDPLKDVLDYQMQLRLKQLRKSRVRNPSLVAQATTAKVRWGNLLGIKASSVSPSAITTNTTPTDVRVAPFILSSWNQSTANSDGPACYNYYTPPYAPGSSSNDVCGCVATAFSQIVRYWQYPTNSVGTASFPIYINDVPTNANLRGGDGAGGPYQWSLMPLVPDVSIQPAQAQAIGALIHDIALLAGMDFSPSGSGASPSTVVPNLLNSFHYSNAVDVYTSSSFDTNSIATIITPSLDAKSPVALGIQGNVGGHEVVCDGYGYYNGVLYHHLNFGWGGDNNVWYLLPAENTDSGNFNIVNELSFNIFPKQSGEIISGRVADTLGTPLAGATVTAQLNQTNYTTVTDSNGIYAIYPVPANSGFVVSATMAGFATPSQSQNVIIKKSISGYMGYGADSGSISGVDFQLTVTNQITPTFGSFTIPVQIYGPTQFTITPPSSPSGGSFSYNCANPAVASVIGNTLTINGEGTTSITATQEARGLYQSATTTAQLVVVQALIGQPFYLPTTLSGQSPLSYQWYKNNQPIPGATSSVLNMGALSATNAGFYSVKVTDGTSLTSTQGTFVLPSFAKSQVRSWGSDTNGNTNVPAGLSNAVAISAGATHSLALKSDGTVTAWGDNSWGQINVSQGLTNVVQMSANLTYSLALKSDGTVTAWGTDNYGSIKSMPQGLNNVIAVAAGGQFALALKNGGTVVGWGNVSGSADGNPAIVPAGLTNVIAIAAGWAHALALKSDGTVTAWGTNDYGQTSVPFGLTNVVAIAAGNNVSMALKNDGSIISWGQNNGGQINVPPTLTNAIAISTSPYWYSLALTASGMPVPWGFNATGSQATPTNLGTVSYIAAGGYFALALQGTQLINAFSAIPSQTYSNGATVTITPPTASSSLPVTVTVKSGPATIAGNTVTLTGAGTVVLAANQSGNANYTAASEVTTSFSVAQSSQTIGAFATIPGHSFGDTPFAVSVPNASSGLPVLLSVKSGPATISGNTVTMTGVGTVVLAADQAGNSNYLAATQVMASFSVGQGIQTISFGALTNRTYGSAPFTLSGLASSGLGVSYSSSSTNISITSNTVTILGVGTATITASQPGNTNWSAATPVNQNVVIAPASQAINAFTTIPNQTYSNGATVTITPPTASSSLPVTVSVKSGPATISGNTITLTGAGTVVLAANQSGNANYTSAVEVTTSFSVGQGNQTISFPSIPNQTYGTGPVRLMATASSGLPVSYSSSFGNISLSSNVVTILGAGTATITASQAGNTNWSSATPVSQNVVIAPASQTINAFTTIPNQTFSNGATVTITPPSAGSSLPVTVTVKSGPATISGNTVTLTGAGTVVLAANQSGNANYTSASEVTTSFTVNPSAQTIGAFATIPGHSFGDTPFAVSVPNASSGLPVKLSVLSGPATISSNMVTITGVGRVVLAADQAGNSNYLAATQVTASFSVVQGNQTISFGSLTNRIYGGAPFTLSGTASSGLPVSYSSSSTNIGLSSNVVTILGVGTATITASQPGNTNWNAATPVHQNVVIAPASQAINAFTTIPNQTYSNGASVTITPPTASSSLPVSVTVKSGPATISSNTVTLTGAGTVILAANQAGNANYLAASEVTTSFSVGAGSQSISFPAIPNQTITTNPIALGATASSGLPISFSVLSGSASMLSSNALTLSGIGTITIQASQTGNTNWSAATPVSQSFVVSKGSQTITFTPFPTNTYGQMPYKLTNASASSGLPVTYTSSTTGVASIVSNTLTIIGAGTTTITASQAGTTNWNAATAVTQKLVVAKASNTITAFKTISNPTYASNAIVSLPQPLPVSSSGLPVTLSVKSGPAVMSGTNAVKMTGAGAVVLAANQTGNANYVAASEVTNSFQILQATQSITPFTAILAKTNGVAPFIIAVPTASSGLPVTLSVLSGPASVTNSTVTLMGAGTVTLAANQAGNGNYLTAPQVTTSFNVAKGNQTITFAALAAVTTGTSPFKLGATASSGLLVSYSSSSTNIALSSNMVTVLGAGTATITASQSGNTNWNSATNVAQKLVVTAPATAINTATNQIIGIGVASTIPSILVRSTTFPLMRSQNRGSVVAWGNSSYSQTNVPTGLTNVVQLSTWGLHSLALKTNGTVIAWGWNAYHQTNVPISVTNAVQIAAGVSFSAALRANGTIVAWGDNSLGQTNIPDGLTNAVQIAAGSDHALALRSDGTVTGWGWNTYGQTTVPADATNVVQIAAGYFHSVALKADGTIEAWGDDTYGETDVPVSLTNVVRIATGLCHTVALKGDGTVVVWGWNSAGQTNVPTGLSGVNQVASGGNTVYAVTTNGTLVTWGDNSYGQRKPPAGLNNVIQFVIGLYHGLGLKR